jgi:hypothetical protein
MQNFRRIHFNPQQASLLPHLDRIPLLLKTDHRVGRIPLPQRALRRTQPNQNSNARHRKPKPLHPQRILFSFGLQPRFQDCFTPESSSLSRRDHQRAATLPEHGTDAVILEAR